jgi:beta-lactamase superfamily II metal-dependent hydrolase
LPQRGRKPGLESPAVTFDKQQIGAVMPARHLINVDLAKVFRSSDRKGLLEVLTWGASVDVLQITTKHVKVRATDFEKQPDGSIKPVPVEGFIVPPRGVKPASVVVERAKNTILKVDFVDVQQGDGAVLETPKGKVMLIDGGDNQMFARYLASRFRGTTEARPKEIDCILVSHGDADHFKGLTEIHKSETNKTKFKQLFILPRRVYHNGIVKRPTKQGNKSLKVTELLGKTVANGKDLVITGLEADLLAVPDKEMNQPFLEWKNALSEYNKRAKRAGKGKIVFRRLELGDDKEFDFLADDGLKVEVLGPLTTTVGGKKGLKFLRTPPKGPRSGSDVLSLEDSGRGSPSASHTINGHSVILRITYKGFSFLFSGDLNDEAERALTRAHNSGDVNLQAEVFKVPHHGSADFSGAFLQAVAPVVSVVSSGDENQQKEFIHPRATLVGSLGKYSRLEEPLVFVTELVAFFQVEKMVSPECHRMKDGVAVVKDGAVTLDPKARKPFFAFSRAAFGLVTVRTDGERLLVCTNSGRTDLKEAYAFEMNETGKPVPVALRAV